VSEVVKVVLYSRVSTEEQSLESQIDDLKQFCKSKENVEVVNVFSDEITGASKVSDRPGFDKMKNYLLLNRDIQHIYCWEYSRIGRSFIDTFNIIEHYREMNVNIYFKKEDLNTLNCTSSEQFSLNILASIAEYERDQIKERTKRGREYAILKEGKVAGAAFQPFGYTKERKVLKIDEDEKEWVERIFKMYVEDDYSTTQIANVLNTEPVKTKYRKHVEEGKIEIKSDRLKRGSLKWSAMTVSNVLKNRLVTGVREWNKTVFPYDEDLEIISEELFIKANDKLKSSKVTNANAQKYENVLKNCIKCAYCDSGYMMHKGNPKTSKANVYKCYKKTYKEGRCESPEINIKLLNNIVYFFLQNAVRNDDKVKEKKENIQLLIDANNITIKELRDINEAEKGRLKGILRDKYQPNVNQYVLEELNNLEGEINTTLANNDKEINKLIKQNIKYEVENENIDNDESLKLSNPDIFKRYVKNVINQIQIIKLDNDDLLKELFPKRKRGYVYYVTIDAVLYGYYQLICANGFDYFYILVGECFDDNGNFIGGTKSYDTIQDKDSGIAEEVVSVTPMYMKTGLPDVIKIDG
jgi:DNA invertase Pin-like site-specific DNA recombinase